MSAEILREAAAEMRRDAQIFCHRDHVFYHAVADWLDAEAEDLPDGVVDTDFVPCELAAIAAARAYLAELP